MRRDLDGGSFPTILSKSFLEPLVSELFILVAEGYEHE